MKMRIKFIQLLSFKEKFLKKNTFSIILVNIKLN